MADGWSEFVPAPSSETAYKGIRAVVIGTHREFQRPQHTRMAQTKALSAQPKAARQPRDSD